MRPRRARPGRAPRLGRLALALALCAVAAGRAGAQPEVTLRAEKAAARKVDVALSRVAATGGGAAARDGAALVTRVLLSDLKLSGFFGVGGSAASDGLDSTRCAFAIRGTLSGDPPAAAGAGTPPALSLELVSLPAGELVLGKRYGPAASQLRATAHHFVDQVVQLLAGVPGICLTRIAFSRGAGDRRDLYVVDYDGENLLRLTANRTLNLCPSWSPDGKRIAFTSYYRGQQGVYLLDTATGKVRLALASTGLNLAPTWRPDGKELLVSLSRDGNPEIYRIDLEGHLIRRLTIAPSIEVSAHWSPNDRDIVFTSDRTGSPQLYTMDQDGAARSRLTFEGTYNDSGVWSPDGSRIAFATRNGNVIQIVVVNADGSDRRVLTDASWRHAEDPDWARDGRHIVFSSDRTGASKLYVIDTVDGSTRQLTTGGEPDITPTWSR